MTPNRSMHRTRFCGPVISSVRNDLQGFGYSAYKAAWLPNYVRERFHPSSRCLASRALLRELPRRRRTNSDSPVSHLLCVRSRIVRGPPSLNLPCSIPNSLNCGKGLLGDAVGQALNRARVTLDCRNVIRLSDDIKGNQRATDLLAFR